MRKSPLFAVPLVLLAACTTPESHRVEANDLARATRAVTGVADVDLTYVEPITFDSADVKLEVTMAKDAPTDGVVNVVKVVYAGFSENHEHEEADLDIRFEDYQLHLRAFESTATVEEVTAAAEQVVDVLRSGGAKSAGLDTQWPPKSAPLRATLCFHAPRDASRREVRTMERELADRYGTGLRFYGRRHCISR